MKAFRHTRRYAGIVFAAVAAATLIAAAVNTRVDPLRMTRAPWADASLDPYRDISAATRTGKTGLLRARKDWQGAIFGSSRVISALDPQAPGWGEMRVVNLGMPGAFLHENVAMAEFFLRSQPAELVVFGVDPGDLTSPMDTRAMSDFMSSPLNPQGALDRELRYVVGLSTFESSLETLSLKARGKRGEYNDHGLRDRPGHAGGGAAGGKNQLNFIKNRFVDDARIATPAEPALNGDKTAKLEKLMKLCRERGVRPVFFLHPNHVLLRAKSADLGKAVTPFETDRRALGEMVARVNALDLPGPPVELWDFYSFHPYNRERVRPLEGQPNELVHWRDLEHFTKDVGEGMLAIMLGWPVTNPDLRAYGEKLSPEHVEDRISRLRDDYRAYLQEELDGDIAWKEKLISEGLKK